MERLVGPIAGNSTLKCISAPTASGKKKSYYVLHNSSAHLVEKIIKVCYGYTVKILIFYAKTIIFSFNTRGKRERISIRGQIIWLWKREKISIKFATS